MSEWLIVAGAGIVVFIANLLFAFGLKRVPAITGSILGLFEPLSAIVYGLLFFSEIPGMQTLFGFVLIIISIVYLTVKSERKQENL
jgi:drug/metabolite transporter (DMT)-like permease